MNSTQAKALDINDFLARKGVKSVHRNASGVWYHSPFSSDATPSFKVTLRGDVFYDWSTGYKGTIIDLALLLLRTRDVSLALQDISETMGIDGPYSIVNSKSMNTIRPAIRLIDVRPLQNCKLYGYAYGRGITRDILHTYCQEVHYSVRGREYYAIGFPNNSGGFELRSTVFKGCIAPKDITTINDLADCPFLVFEGFFNFLSAVRLEWFNPLAMNAVVLNSTAIVEKSFGVLQNASQVICMLDRDKSGQATTQRILQKFPNAKDASFSFEQQNDLNDFLCARLSE